jgi:ABC-type branched-subunit amino acid transport system permease subunit
VSARREAKFISTCGADLAMAGGLQRYQRCCGFWPTRAYGVRDHWLYLFVLAHVVLLFICAANLLRGKIGRAVRAIRDQPIAAQTAGINSASPAR